ncbi:hypothetical protein DPMN_032390 [Dreissena polymorpha]|uniref:Uncharacterized protein n=1 Tax=Dreissena polymorpha TaxID=45954 RepID=A0A9D4M2S6_DREPO|nr:hypothetical protein DPMN_032390 [Dreissena polymorpha]
MSEIQFCTARTTNIISLEPPINKCFGPLITGHSPGGGLAVLIRHYVLVVGFQFLFSSSSTTNWMPFLLLCSVCPLLSSCLLF